MSAPEFPTDEEAAAIADEADIIIRSLESRVAKMEKSDASTLQSTSLITTADITTIRE